MSNMTRLADHGLAASEVDIGEVVTLEEGTGVDWSILGVLCCGQFCEMVLKTSVRLMHDVLRNDMHASYFLVVDSFGDF